MLANKEKRIKGIVELTALKILRGTQVLNCVHEVLYKGTEHWDIRSKVRLIRIQPLFTFQVKHECKGYFMLLQR